MEMIDKNADVGVPAASDADDSLAIAQAAVRYYKEDVPAAGAKFESDLRDFRFFAPGVAQHAWRIVARDGSMHRVAAFGLVVFVGRSLFSRKSFRAPVQFDSSADPEFHLAGSKPLPAFLRLGKVRTRTFDWSRQNAFKPERAGFGDSAVLTCCFRLLALFLPRFGVHRGSPFFLLLRTFAAAGSSVRNAASRASSRAVQNERCLSIQLAGASSGWGLNESRYSRPPRRRRTRPAPSSTMMWLETALSDSENGWASAVTPAS